MTTAATIDIDGRAIELSHPLKVLFPDSNLTKRGLVEYFTRIAELALPHWRDRPVTLRRFPDGIAADGFFQKSAPDHRPDWIPVARLEHENHSVDYVVVNDRPTLVWLAQLDCVELHLGLSTTASARRPDRLIFDLDPPDDDFERVQSAAQRVREALKDLDLDPLVQTTGSRGLHVVQPIRPEHDFDQVHAFARSFAERLVERHPDALTMAQRKDQRRNRVFIDYLRNSYGQTAVAPYSVRARAHAPIATPLTWDEALASGLSPRDYRVDNIFRRLGQREDPWRHISQSARSLGPALDRLGIRN